MPFGGERGIFEDVGREKQVRCGWKKGERGYLKGKCLL
jgi:hypothetical protein